MRYEVGKATELYSGVIKRKRLIMIILFAVLIVTTLVAICVGTASVSIKDILGVIFSSSNGENALNETVIMKLRLPRVLTAIIVGASLAGSGAVMQGVLRNPLVSPYTLGVSSGAAFGAALAIVFGISVFGSSFAAVSNYVVVGNAFIFGLISMVLVYSIAKVNGMATSTLILAGVAISYLFSALVSIVKYASNKDKLNDIVFWLMGGLWNVRWSGILLLFVINAVCLILMAKYSWDLNGLGSGDEVAISLGVNINKVRRVCLVLCALSTSSCIAFTGIIGFVGLVAPHVSRIVIGSDNRFQIPCSCLMGAILLLISDTLARTMISPTEIPVGIVTSLIGAPFFIYLIIRKRRSCLF